MGYFVSIILIVVILLTQNKIITLNSYMSFVFYLLAYITISSLFAYSYTSFLYLLHASGLAASVLSLTILLRKNSTQSLGINMPKDKIFLYILMPLMFLQILISFGWGFLMEQFWGVSQEQEFMTSLLDINSTSLWIFGFLVVSVVIPLIEELLFRGVFAQICIEKKVPLIQSVLINGILFGCMHMSTIAAVVPLSIFGCILTYLRLKSHSIVPSLFLHMLNNFIVILFYWSVNNLV
jgi:membrane protease YdiL (CAAX protease family)